MNTCIECGKEFKLGKFAYQQEICWDCFCEEVENILRHLEKFHPSFSHNDCLKHREMVDFMMYAVAATYGEEWSKTDQKV